MLELPQALDDYVILSPPPAEWCHGLDVEEEGQWAKGKWEGMRQHASLNGGLILEPSYPRRPWESGSSMVLAAVELFLSSNLSKLLCVALHAGCVQHA